MQWKDLPKLIGSAAPLIGGLIGGPAGAAVGQIAASALGVDATPDAVATALKTDPAAAVKLRQIEADERTRLAEIAAQQVAAQAQSDAQNDQEVTKRWQSDMSSDSWLSKNVRPLCLTWSIVMLMLLAWSSIFVDLTPSQVDAMKAWAPLLVGLVGIMVSAYFGSRWSEKLTAIKGVQK